MKKKLLIILACAAAACAGFFIFLAVGSGPADPADRSPVYVDIEEGSGAYDAAAKLVDRDLIKSELAFKIKARFSGSGIKAGTYAVKRSMSAGDIIDMMTEGRVAAKTFRINAGLSLYKIAAELERQDICTEEEFYDEVENGSFDHPFMKYLPDGPARLEGFLYPDTYTIGLKDGAHEAIEIMLKNFDAKVTDSYYKKAAAEGTDIYKTIVKASIIEREARIAEDKPKVSSVIDNRLATDMNLQMDSIIAYIHQEDKVIASYSDIAVESDYNPYTNKGLPPGPICSPGMDSIEAALEPAETDYLYFVNSAKLDGSLTFCETDKEFAKANKAFKKAYAGYLKEHPEEADE